MQIDHRTEIEKLNQNQSHHVRVILPALWASYK